MLSCKQKTRILFLLKEKSYGSHGFTTGLLNSASFVVKFLRGSGYDVEIKVVKDANCIDREVTIYNPKIVILEALWFTPEKIKEILTLKRHKGRSWIVRIHSKAPFLANEGISIHWIKEYSKLRLKNFYIAPNTRELTEQLDEVFDGKFVYLPNVYHIENFTPHEKKEENYLDIGCFGAIRPMKNTFQQAIAAIAFANKLDRSLRFHINSSRVEQGGENVLKNLKALFKDSRHRLVEHPWLSHKEFLSLISKMDLGTQISFSESFNIVSADFVTVGIPIIVSEDIEWMPNFLKVEPTNYKGMVRKLSFAYSWGKILKFFQKIYLKADIAKAKKHWLKFVKKID